MKGRIALYALGIGIVTLSSVIFNHLAYGKPILLDRLPLIVLIAPLLGYFIWLRWDWAPAQRRKTLERRAQDEDR